MMTQIILSPLARQDLIDIGDYIAQDNLTAALETIDLIEEKVVRFLKIRA